MSTDNFTFTPYEEDVSNDTNCPQTHYVPFKKKTLTLVRNVAMQTRS